MAKNWVRRAGGDESQGIRRGVQLAFLLLNIWIGVEFYRFVEAPSLRVRPPGVEGWLPIAGMMNTKYWLTTGEIPVIHPSAMFLFIAFVAVSLLARKSFCGWLCPVGTISEYLWRLGRDTFGRNFHLPKWLDMPLRSLKYILAGLFLYAVGSMAAPDIRAFLASPYGIVVDVQMLNFFRQLSITAAVTIGVLVIGSVFVQNFWCRYLCPYGAVMGLAALLSPMRIRRVKQACIDCGKCAKACPSGLPVDRLVQVRSAECMGCMSCVAACPAEGALAMRIEPVGHPVSPRLVAALIAVVFFGITGLAMWTGHWASPIPAAMYERLIPLAAQFGHP